MITARPRCGTPIGLKYAEQMARLQAVAGRSQGEGHRQDIHHLPLSRVLPLGPRPYPRARQSAQDHLILREGFGTGRVQRARPHHRVVQRRRGEISVAGRRRRGARPDPARPDEPQGPRRLSARLSTGRAEPPKEHYNYVLVDVEPGQKTRFTLNPLSGRRSADPFASDDLFT